MASKITTELVPGDEVFVRSEIQRIRICKVTPLHQERRGEDRYRVAAVGVSTGEVFHWDAGCDATWGLPIDA